MPARNLPLLSIFLLGSAISADTLAGAWDASSNPYLIDPRFEARLELLPTEGRLSESARPWSGPFWADNKGSIGYDWVAKGETKPLRPTLETLRRYSPEQLAALRPAEKIDIVRGLYDYPTVREVELATAGNPRGWEGLCTGWAQTSLLFSEPTPVVRENADGIKVPFGSADLKALAAYYFDKVAVRTLESGEEIDERRVVQMGKVCDKGDPRGDCRRDVNAGALHILLANRIGNQNRGVIADFSRGRKIWQHPIHGYSAEILGERSPHRGAAPNTEREVQVRLELVYADYASAQWEPTGLRERERKLRYWLELDSQDRIVGGHYTTLGGGRALDYLWTSEMIPFANGYEILGELLSPRR